MSYTGMSTWFVSPSGDDANTGLTPDKPLRTLAAAATLLNATNGGTIRLAYGEITETATATFNKPVRIIGCGQGVAYPVMPSRVTYPAGVAGIILNAAAQTSQLRDFVLSGSDVALGTNDGLLIRAHGTILDGLQVQYFGRDGVVMDTTVSGNANDCRFGNVRINNNFRHGLYMAGVDVNLLVAEKLACAFNGGWGVYISASSVYGQVFLAPNIEGNTLGGVSDAGTGSKWLNPDVEPGTGYNVTLTGTDIMWMSDGKTSPTITFSNLQGVTRGHRNVGRSVITNSTFANQYAWTSGVFEATSLGLVDDTNAVNVLHYRPLTKRFTHLTPLHVSGASLYLSAVAVAYAASVSFDTQLGNIFVVPLTGNATSSAFSTANIAGAPLVTITWQQDATGGRTYAWPTNCKFAGNVAPSDTTANTSTSVTFRYDSGATKWYEVSRSVAVPV